MRAVAKHLVPARDELADLLSQLEDAGSDTSVANKPGRSPSHNQQSARRSVRRRVSVMVVLVDARCSWIRRRWFSSAEESRSTRSVLPTRASVGRETNRWSRSARSGLRSSRSTAIAAEDIVAFSWRTYVDKWRKRFEEDLVEVLTRMGHEPKDTVRLVVSPLGSSETRTLEDVPMTEANRWAIFNAAVKLAINLLEAAAQQVTRWRAWSPIYRKEKNLVGLAAMVMVDGQVEAAAAHGERKIGSGVPLEIGDRWHLGGITKSITATMIARLVESGQMQWTDTVGEIFPEASVHEDWKPVTLRQLLTDTAVRTAKLPQRGLAPTACARSRTHPSASRGGAECDRREASIPTGYRSMRTRMSATRLRGRWPRR